MPGLRKICHGSSSWNHQQELGDTNCVSGEHHPTVPQDVPWAQASAAVDPSSGRGPRVEDCRGAGLIVRSKASGVLLKLSGVFTCLLFGRSACDCDYPPAFTQSAELTVRSKHKVVGCPTASSMWVSLRPDRNRRARAARLAWIRPAT